MPAGKFEEEEISADLLPFLDEMSLRCLGVTSLGARLKLRLAGQALFTHGSD